jgi:hypothetical protein
MLKTYKMSTNPKLEWTERDEREFQFEKMRLQFEPNDDGDFILVPLPESMYDGHDRWRTVKRKQVREDND